MTASPARQETEQEELTQELQRLGVPEDQIKAYFDTAASDTPPEQILVAENKPAFDWFQDVAADCLAWQPLSGPMAAKLLCTGLDLSKVAADLQLNPRDYGKQDYQKLRRLGRYLADRLNRDS